MKELVILSVLRELLSIFFDRKIVLRPYIYTHFTTKLFILLVFLETGDTHGQNELCYKNLIVRSNGVYGKKNPRRIEL